MKKSIISLNKQIDECKARIKRIQTACKHINVNKEFGSDTGNYDPSCDRYWTNSCTDCGHRWTVFYNTKGEVCKII